MELKAWDGALREMWEARCDVEEPVTRRDIGLSVFVCVCVVNSPSGRNKHGVLLLGCVRVGRTGRCLVGSNHHVVCAR